MHSDLSELSVSENSVHPNILLARINDREDVARDPVAWQSNGFELTLCLQKVQFRLAAVRC